MDLANRSVLITGAGTGIGAALATRLAAEGACVTLTGRRIEPLRETAAACGAPGRVQVVAGDMTAERDVERAFAEARRAFGPLSVLVNNMVAPYGGAFAETNVDELRRMVVTNLLAPMELSLAALPDLRATRGTIVNVISLAGLMALSGQAAYAATKFGMRGFSQVIDRELAPHGVRVLAAYPGSVDSESNSHRLRDLLRRRGIRFSHRTADRAATPIVDAIRGDRRGPLFIGSLPERLIGRLANHQSFVIRRFVDMMSGKSVQFMTEATQMVRERDALEASSRPSAPGAGRAGDAGAQAMGSRPRT